MENRDYLDARFDGLEKLVTAKFENLNEYVGAVSRNVKEVREELQEHKDNQDAHGAALGRRTSDRISAWGSILIAAVALAVTLWKHG